MSSQRAFGDPGPRLRAWRYLGVLLTLVMLAGLGAVAWGVNELRTGASGSTVYATLGGGALAAILFGFVASRAGKRVEYLEGGLVPRETRRLDVVAGFFVLLGIVAVLWFQVFTWV